MSGDSQKRAAYYCRARVTKDEPLRYISHLDYASTMQRAIRRAKLPAAYSEGFNPHMKLSFASALAVGVTSDAEYMDFELTERVAQEEIEFRLRRSLPEGVRLLALRVLAEKPKALMAVVDEAQYEITVPLRGDFAGAEAALAAFDTAESCVFFRETPKKKREIEIRQYMRGKVHAQLSSGGTARLTMAIRITPGGSVKPQEVLTVLCEKFALPVRMDEALVRRVALLGGGRPLLSEEVAP